MRNLNNKIPLFLFAIFLVYITFTILFLTFVYEAREKAENATIVSHIVNGSSLKFKPSKNLIITVKTSSIYYSTRLKYILETWYRLAPHLIYFISDSPDPNLSIDLGNYFLYSDCGSSHQRAALACKLTAELEVFYKAKKDWSCHFDDDNYVNIPNLERFLAGKDPNLPHYFGKISVKNNIKVKYRNESVSFTFGTGGAGFCLSRVVVERLYDLATRNITVLTVSNETELTDDMTLGFILSHFLNIPLTEVPQFHSHIEGMYRFNKGNIANEISLSAFKGAKFSNAVNLSPIPVDTDKDGFRFRAIHCLLFPRMCSFTDEV